LSRNQPSSGLTQWQYDNAGNIIKEIMSSGEEINYGYDYNQITEVDYSDRPWNNVYYKYGENGEGNETGRLKKQQDASGVQEFGYDEMGNIIQIKDNGLNPREQNYGYKICTIFTRPNYYVLLYY
jgi:hypothetical protein